MSDVIARDLVKRYGRVTALDGLSLQIEPGEIFGFLGPNGAARPRRSDCCSGC